MASGVSRIDAAVAQEGAVESEDPKSATAVSNPAVGKGAEFRSRLHWFIGASDVRTQDPGSLTYEPYYNLREKPFSLSSDPRFFFSHSSHGAAFDTLAAGIRRREGILVLSGEVGTGKTTLCRAVLQSLDQKTFAAYVPDPFLSREDLLKTLLVDFGVVSVDEIRSGRLRGASRTDLSYPLYDFLTSLQPLKAFAVVMIDEAQNLTEGLLEEIRILSDLENGQKLLEVVLVGQPELRARLASSALRQLSQRVSIRCELAPLVRADITRYVSHRLTVAGNDGRVRFTDPAIELLWAASNGNPRVINLVCDRALLCASRARTMNVTAEHVAWAIDDLKLPGAETLDQAPALESFPEEFPDPPPGHDELLSAGVMPGVDEPGYPFKSFHVESVRAPSGSKPLPQAPPSAVLFPVAAAAAASPPEPAGRVEPSPVLDLSGTPFWQTGLDGAAGAGTGNTSAGAVERQGAFDAAFAAVPQGRRRWLAPVAVVLSLILGIVGYSLAPWSQQQSDVVEQPEQTREAVNPSSMPEGTLNPSAPREPAVAGSPARESERAEARVPEPVNPLEGFALQMATFQSGGRAAQAVQEFRDAGYLAYSVERSLRDGTGAHAVFLGPYTERAAAELDRERARQVPGYGIGIIVPIVPAAAQKTP